jgi:hypothetical protein
VIFANVRTMGHFESTLGTRCPLCGKAWYDRSSCGPSVYMSWKEQNDAGLLFPGRRGLVREVPQAIHECPVCKGVFVGFERAVYCGTRCRAKAGRDRAGDAGRAANLLRVNAYRARRSAA